MTAWSRGEHDNCPHKQLLPLTRAALLLTDSLSTIWRSRERKTDSALNSDDLTESEKEKALGGKLSFSISGIATYLWSRSSP